jgi:toxin ParE1/3/4
MNRKPVILRALARSDAEAAIDYYIGEADEVVAARFIDALEAAYWLIGEHPASGSLRHVHELALPDLRSVPLKGFPWLVFYVARGEHIDVWHVLHAQRDIPVWLKDSESRTA